MCWSDLREFGRLLLERWFKDMNSDSSVSEKEYAEIK